MPPEDPTALVAEAIHNYFDYKSELARRAVRVLLLEGRTSLVIGIAFLALCLLAAEVLSAFATGTFLKILRESLTIGGWVAMWRPMQIFLYEWWPLVRRRRIYRSLSRAQVHVSQGKAESDFTPLRAWRKPSELPSTQVATLSTAARLVRKRFTGRAASS